MDFMRFPGQMKWTAGVSWWSLRHCSVRRQSPKSQCPDSLLSSSSDDTVLFWSCRHRSGRVSQLRKSPHRRWKLLEDSKKWIFDEFFYFKVYSLISAESYSFEANANMFIWTWVEKYFGRNWDTFNWELIKINQQLSKLSDEEFKVI